MRSRYLDIKHIIIYIIVVLIVISIIYQLINKKKYCIFCGRKAKWNRKLKPEVVKQYKLHDMSISFAESQDIYCCEECKAIAGGFRTTKWDCLHDCHIPPKTLDQFDYLDQISL